MSSSRRDHALALLISKAFAPCSALPPGMFLLLLLRVIFFYSDFSYTQIMAFALCFGLAGRVQSQSTLAACSYLPSLLLVRVRLIPMNVFPMTVPLHLCSSGVKLVPARGKFQQGQASSSTLSTWLAG